MRVKYNDHLENLWCNECKSLIDIGEKYIEDIEHCLGDKIKKYYHIDCTPVESEDDINELFDQNSDINEDDIEDYEGNND